jgi:hypothetical protein
MMDLGTVVPADTKTAQHLEIIGEGNFTVPLRLAAPKMPFLN